MLVVVVAIRLVVAARVYENDRLVEPFEQPAQDWTMRHDKSVVLCLDENSQRQRRKNVGVGACVKKKNFALAYLAFLRSG